jgi:hypothetical protein
MTHPASFKNTWHGTGYNGKRCELQPVVNNVKSKRVMDKNMKKTILASLTVAAALVASAPLAKADAFLELISGTSTVQTSIGPNNVTLSSVTVGSWSLGVTATGTGTGVPFLVANLQTVDNNDSPTMGLTVIYSSGFYNYPGNGAIFGLTANGSSLASTASLYTGSALYTGSGSLGTQFMSTLNEGAGIGSTSEAGALGANPNMYVTEMLSFGGGASASLGVGSVNINGTASVTSNVPDGGLTMMMLGSSILLLAGIRSRFSKKS